MPGASSIGRDPLSTERSFIDEALTIAGALRQRLAASRFNVTARRTHITLRWHDNRPSCTVTTALDVVRARNKRGSAIAKAVSDLEAQT